MLAAQLAVGDEGVPSLDCATSSRSISETTWVPGFEPGTDDSATETAEKVVDSPLVPGTTDDLTVDDAADTVDGQVMSVVDEAGDVQALITLDETPDSSWLPTVVEACQ